MLKIDREIFEELLYMSMKLKHNYIKNLSGKEADMDKVLKA